MHYIFGVCMTTDGYIRKILIIIVNIDVKFNSNCNIVSIDIHVEI